MFSALAAGAYLFISGVIGWNLGTMRGSLQGSRWADGPIWSQIALGVALLLLGTYWSRRLDGPGWTFTRAPRNRIVKNVGSGRTRGADQSQQRRSLTGGGR